jgi:competence protein ComEC
VRTPLVPLALAFALGVASSRVAPLLVWWAIWLVGVGATAVLVVTRPAWGTPVLLACVVATGALRAIPLPAAEDDVARLALPRDALIEGTIIRTPLRLGPARHRAVLAIERLDGRPASGTVQATVFGHAEHLAEGQRVRVPARLREAFGFRNPGGFDYRAFLARDGIHVLATANARDLALVEDRSPWHAEVRRRVLATIDASLPPVSAGLLGGLLVGARRGLPADTIDDFRRAGVYHVLAVSGFNVALVSSAVFAVMLLGGASRAAAAAASIVVVVGFAAVAGPEPSVLRAAIMAVVVLGAVLLDREASILNGVALAALVILAVRPGDLLDPGFQLSFAATLGIVLAPIPRGLVSGGIAVGLAAQIAVLPVTVVHFNQVSTVGVLANLAAVPLAGVATVLGLVALTVSMVSETVSAWLFDASWPVLLLLRAVAMFAARVPGALVHWPAPHWTAVAAYAASLLLALVGWRTRTNAGRVSAVSLAGAFWLLVVASAVGAWSLVRPADGQLRVTVLDAGKADAVVVEAPDGTAMAFVAGGRPDVADRVIAPYLWHRNIRRLAGAISGDARGDVIVSRLARLVTVADRPPESAGQLGPASMQIARLPDGMRIALGYRAAAIDLTLVQRAGDEPREPLVRINHAPALDVLSRLGARDATTDPRDARAGPVLPGDGAARTDHHGAIVIETDGRTIDVTRWARQTSARFCVDAESPCPSR